MTKFSTTCLDDYANDQGERYRNMDTLHVKWVGRAGQTGPLLFVLQRDLFTTDATLGKASNPGKIQISRRIVAVVVFGYKDAVWHGQRITKTGQHHPERHWSRWQYHLEDHGE